MAHYAPAFLCAFLLHALALAAAGGWFTWRPSDPARPERPSDHRVVVFSVAPEDARFPGLTALAPGERDWQTRPDTPAQISHADFTFEVAKIASHAQVLFPFVTPGIAWEHFILELTPVVDARLQNPYDAGHSRKPRGGPPRALDADEAELQRLADKTWSRRHRWDAFQPIVRLADKYSADAGRLPDLLQRYCDQNSLQPYVDTTLRDPRLWVQLGIAADHVDFIGFIRRYAAAHPSTRATTALLFLLDNIAQASRDALAPLLETDPKEELAWTRNADPRAYALIVQLRQYYKRELTRRGLASAEAITRYYESVRLPILEEIVRTSPGRYRVSDARFLMGAIYWRQQRFREALVAWRDMAIDANDSHVATYSRIAGMLERYGTRIADPETASMVSRELDRILKNASGRWFTSSYDRLQHFGYKPDTF